MVAGRLHPHEHGESQDIATHEKILKQALTKSGQPTSSHGRTTPDNFYFNRPLLEEA
jgi:hypothetical protein